MSVERGRETIRYDSEEEFFSDYRNVPESASYFCEAEYCRLNIHFHNGGTDVSVNCASRPTIDSVLNLFEEAVPKSELIQPESNTAAEVVRPKIFIGHGHSGQWRELKDHLTDKHGYEVIAYEVGARAGHSIRDILEDMLTRSSVAFLVLTGEDKDANGLMHPRENVIHECGLFQGKLGFARAIVLLEKGTVEFSNIHGIDQLRFSAGNIKEIFGDVLAVIRREFGDAIK